MATNEIENCDNPEQDGEEWYDKAEKYWKDLPPTISSMLGGHTRLLSIDVTSSRRFLQQFIKGKSDSICTRVALGKMAACVMLEAGHLQLYVH
ncbi:N-terminal Xaa-Pro-Lys N-methyltransferase 1-like [Corticium candelabrum]|uniref:N-terminal Xaa-Pro-Lys N-methyltransferase 1-like n=1 Tax=Corticium candelabrum TaxID=121492 RepID=UPI002E25500F|nr:N-terminal Xaa-Pro-Lys N-methyltransferase 1-like [Corticium candelabrum]